MQEGMHARVHGNEGPHLVLKLHARALDMQCIPCDQALFRHARSQGVPLKMQITKYAFPAFAWVVYHEAFGSVQY